MQKSKILLSKPLSRPSSFNFKLSQSAWKRGLDTFFIDKVPFDYTNSYEFANRLIKIFEAFQHDTSKESMTIAFPGAGIAMLPKHILELIDKSASHLKTKIKFLISDFDSNYKHFLIKSNHLSDYLKHIKIDVFDLMHDDYSYFRSVDIVIFTYVFDSLPARHFEFTKGKLYEYFVSAYIDSKGFCVDMIKDDPILYSGQSLKRFILNVKNNQMIDKFSKIHSKIKEKWIKRVAKNIGKSESSLLSFLNQYGAHEIKFNYSEDINDIVKKLCAHLQKDSMVLVYDFGDVLKREKKAPNKSYYAKFGSTFFLSIFFPFIKYIIEHPWKTLISGFKNGESQCLIFHNIKNPSYLANAFSTLFKTPGSEQSHNAIKKINQSKKSNDKLLTFIKSIYFSLTPLEQLSYELNLAIAIRLKKNFHYTEALYYINKNIQNFGPIAVSSYQLLADIYIEQKKYKESLSIIDPLCIKHPYHSGLQYIKCVATGHLFPDKLSLEIRKYFQRSDDFIPWRFFIIFALSQKNKINKQKILEWIKHCSKNNYTHIDEKIILDLNNYLYNPS